MIINTLQDNITSPIYKAVLYGFEKISICANTVFSLVGEEANAWKAFFSNNIYISKLYSIGSRTTASIAKKIFDSSNQIDIYSNTSNAPLEELESSNKAWIRDHSLFHKDHPNFNASNEVLLDIIFSKDIDSEGIIQFAKDFCTYRENTHLSRSLSDWEKAYRQQQIIQKPTNQSQEIEQISRDLSKKTQGLTRAKNHIVLLLEKELDSSNSPLSNHIGNFLEGIRSRHNDLYQTLYSNIKEKLQFYLNTNLKKRIFTEIQEEVRAILLDQYSNIYQQSTLGYNLPLYMQQLLSEGVGLPHPPNGNESLAAVIWDLFLQNGIDEAANEPISIEKLNQIFEKEFEMITHGIEATAMAGINRFIENAGEDLQPLLQLWHSKLPQKERGWLEITYQSEEHCQIKLYARDMTSPINNIIRSGETSPMKVYSYNSIPKALLQTEFFYGLLSGLKGNESPISSIENIKQFFSQFGKPIESHIQSSRSKVPKNGLLDHIETYYAQVAGSSIVESPEKTFFQMRLHAFINYCKSIQDSQNVTQVILSTIEDGVSALLEDTNTLYDTGQISDQEYIAIISTALEIEECVIQKQQNLRAEVQSSEMIVPAVIKEQLRNLFSSSNISRLDIENVKSFANVLLGDDMSEEVSLLCKELPITNQKQSAYIPYYVPLLKVMKDLCIDIKNLRNSPVALFRVYSDVRKLLSNTRTIITLLSYIPYVYLLACCTNPTIALAYIVGAIIAVGILYNTPQLEPILNIYASMLNFHREIYAFALTRLLVRLIQIVDIAVHWKETVPIQATRSFLTKNLSRTVSFSLRAPIDHLEESIPQEVKPLQRFYPQMEISTNAQNAREISQVLFPELDMEFNIDERSGVKRAHLYGYPEFWIADTITDRELEGMDLAHLVLENEQGNKKICVVSRPQERLLLQTILKMASSYSRTNIDLLSNYLQNQMSGTPPSVYYYDWVDGELNSQEFDAISYLITHYITSGDPIRSQRLVDQLKKMKANGLEDPGTILKTLEQIAYIVPNSINSDTTKMILELSALCREIPLESKAFPLFMRSYQAYISDKERNHISYISEAEESLLLHHLNNNTEDQIPNFFEKLGLASCTALPQTMLLLANNILDKYSDSTIFGKEGYISASLKKYRLQREYLDGNRDTISLLMDLVINNLINPYFFFSKDMVNLKKNICENKGNIFDILPTIISKLNTESNATKSDYVAILYMLINFSAHAKIPVRTQTRAPVETQIDLPQVATTSMEDPVEEPTEIPVERIPSTNAYQQYHSKIARFIKKELHPILSIGKLLKQHHIEAVIPIARDVLTTFLSNPSNIYRVQEKITGSYLTKYIARTSVKTVQDYVNINNEYKKRQLVRSLHTDNFTQLHMESDYGSLQNLEQNILENYQKINSTFLQKQNRVPSHANPQLDFTGEGSFNDRMIQIVNWYENGHAQASDSTSYILHSSQNRQNLVKRLGQTHEMLRNMSLQQAETIQRLLKYPPQNLVSLANRIEQHTQDIRNNSTKAESQRAQMREAYSNQSTIEKVGTFALRYINTLLEVPTFGQVQVFKGRQVQSLAEDQSRLMEETKLLKSGRRQLFQRMITTLKPQTSLGLHEVYTYFCQGKDSSIIESLGLDDNQWKIIKEQLYRYMILQKHLSHAEYITGLCTDTSRTVEESIDLIGHELDSMSNSLHELPVLEISVRSQLQFEKKLGRSMSPNLRNKLSDIVNGSIDNFQAVHHFSHNPLILSV